MNHQRATNTVAFALVMLSIFFSQVKGPINKLVSAYQGRAGEVFARVDQAAVPAVPAQVELAVVEAKLQRSQAKLACSQQVLQTKMQVLQKAREVQGATRARLITASDEELDQSDWQ